VAILTFCEQTIMTKNQIKKALEDTLFKKGVMAQELYEYELEDMQADLTKMLHEDNEDYIFALTVHKNDVTLNLDTAMILISKSGETYINEIAREQLKILWEKMYTVNMRELLPDFIQQLYADEIPINGIKTVDPA
jgi:hypothetical protein